MKLPEATVIAYDIDKNARENAEKLKRLNQLKNIQIKAECTSEELNEIASEKQTLVFCDIEGYEVNLLDPIKVPNLKLIDLIIESHDWLIPHITEELINRFYKTHEIEIKVDYPFRLNNYTTTNKVDHEVMEKLMDERRPTAMKFMFLKSRKLNE